MRAGAPFGGLALLAGCAAQPPAPVASAPVEGCDAAKAGVSIGQAMTPALAETARTASGAQAVRTIAPGAMVTMDYRPDRLNLTVDDKGVVRAVRCG